MYTAGRREEHAGGGSGPPGAGKWATRSQEVGFVLWILFTYRLSCPTSSIAIFASKVIEYYWRIWGRFRKEAVFMVFSNDEQHF